MTLVTDTVSFDAIALLQSGCCDEDTLNHGLRTCTQVTPAFKPPSPPPLQACKAIAGFVRMNVARAVTLQVLRAAEFLQCSPALVQLCEAGLCGM